MGHIRIGTCSWADKTMVQAWYPPAAASSAEARLRYYADRFDTVEADSPYYGIPPLATTTNWAKRTPDGFTFHVKAYGLMTGHSVDERSLHPELRGYRYGLSARGRVYEPEPAMLQKSFQLFRDAMAPLRDSGRLGGILMQYPPSFAARDAEETRAGLARISRDHELLASDHMLVEFRNTTWVEDPRRDQVLGFLADRGITFVTVDTPRDVGVTAMPTVPAVTSKTAYVRFHGRNRDTWSMQTKTAADRFDYLYARDELARWAEPLREMSEQAEVTFAMFNNCRYDYAPRNAGELAAILGSVSGRSDGLLPGEAHIEQDSRSGTAGENLTLDI